MTTTDQPTEGTRWRGYSHKDLYLMLHDGPGAAASAEPSRRWADIASTLSEIGQDLRKAINQTNDAWSGRAAGAAYDRLETTVVWAENTGESAGAMRLSVEDQGDHIAKARADMPRPEDVPATQPDPTAAPVAQVIQAQTDAEPAESTASSAEERAVEVMAAYEENTNLTTAALAEFTTPRALLGTHDVHHSNGGGLLGILPTVAAGLIGGDSSRHDDHRGRHNDHRNNWHSPSTNESSARWEESRRGPTPGPAPGKMTGIATDPLFTPQARQQERAANRGNSSGSGGAAGNSNNNPAPGPRSGVANMPMAPNDLQAAAASQAAASAHPGAGAPIAPATAPISGGQDKLALRRFGMDAIGSSQWFGDTDEPVVGQSPKRRFDLRDSVDNGEQPAILDDEHHVPPNVIGDLGR